MISCDSKSQVQKVELSKENISVQEIDKETGWKRILLNKPKKWGFIDDKGEITIPFIYDFVNPFENGLAYAKIGSQEFFITIQNLRLKGNYDEVRIFSERIAAVKKNGKWGFINERGELEIPIVYNEVDYFRPSGLCSVTKNGKAGFINKNGKEIIPIIYEEAYQEMKDTNVIVKKNGKWAVFDNTGKQITDFIYDSFKRANITDFSKDVFQRDESTLFENGAALATKKGKYEFLNSDGKTLFSNLKIDSASVFDTFQNAIIKSNGKYGILKIDGTFKVPLEYDFIEYFDDNHAYSEYYNARKGKIYTIFNRDLKKLGETYEPVYNDFSTNTPTLIFKNLNNKYGMLASNGDLLIPFEFDELNKIKSYDFFEVSKRSKFGIVDENGKTLIPLKYNRIYPLYDQFDDIEVRNKSFFIVDDNSIIDINNNIIISGFNSIIPIFENRNILIVSKNKKFGIIDINKNTILPLEYDEISNWTEYGPSHSKFIVKNGKTGLIDDKTYKITIPPIYDKFLYLKGLIFAKKENKAGILNEEGKIICDFIYDEIYPNLSNFYGYSENKPRIYAKKGNSYFQIDAKGKVLKSGLSRKVVIENSQLPGIIPNQVEEPPPPPKLK
jgi:hypothetical protein